MFDMTNRKAISLTFCLKSLIILFLVFSSSPFAFAGEWKPASNRHLAPWENESKNQTIQPVEFNTHLMDSSAYSDQGLNSTPPVPNYPIESGNPNSVPNGNVDQPYYENYRSTDGGSFKTYDPMDPNDAFEDEFVANPETVQGNPHQHHTHSKRWMYYKSASLIGTHVAGSGDDLGITTIDMSATFGFRRWPTFTFTPQFRIHALNGPGRTDLPGQLYDFSTDFSWFIPTQSAWAFQLALKPGIYSDANTSSSDRLRLQGRAIAFYTHSEYWKWVLGVVYLDREDVKALPAIGFIYTPHPNTVLEFIIPRIKLAQRYMIRQQFDNWAYIKGEFGGGSWALERSSGADDVVTYSDLRLIFGVERKYHNGRNLFAEIGLVFNRELEYESRIGDYDPNTTGMLRAGVKF